MNRTSIVFLLVLASIMLASASCKDGPKPCVGDACITDSGMDTSTSMDASDGGSCEGPPGLYADGDCEQLAEGIEAYQPKYWLWSDGLDKERFLYLPPGTQIDTTNPDHWVFPVGTRVYKHFISNGKRLETRLIERVALTGGYDNHGWLYRTFKWNHAQTQVTELIAGEEDVLGTLHDIPSQADCVSCHRSGAQDAILSVSAIQLSHTLPGVTLTSLTPRLTTPISESAATIPGSTVAESALGYLHANCGHCHRPGGAAASLTNLQLFVPTGLVSDTAAPAYTSGMNVCATWMNGVSRVLRADPHTPTMSAIYLRMGIRDMVPPINNDPNQMPPLATEAVDTNGRNIVLNWIDSMPDTNAMCP